MIQIIMIVLVNSPSTSTMSRSTSHDKSFQPLQNKLKGKNDPCENFLETVNNKL